MKILKPDKSEKETTPCKWMDGETEICCNGDCPLCADFCTVAYVPGVCIYEDRED